VIKHELWLCACAYNDIKYYSQERHYWAEMLARYRDNTDLKMDFIRFGNSASANLRSAWKALKIIESNTGQKYEGKGEEEFRDDREYMESTETQPE